jgi:hypothetical protein
MKTAKLVQEITVIDPDSKGDVQLTVYKHENGGMFAMDSSFLDQCCDDDSYPVIQDPFCDSPSKLMLVEDNAISNFIGNADLPQD